MSVTTILIIGGLSVVLITPILVFCVRKNKKVDKRQILLD